MNTLVRKRVDEIKHLLRWKEKIILRILKHLDTENSIDKDKLFDGFGITVTYHDFNMILNFANREGLVDMKVNGMISITTIGKIFLDESKTELDKNI